MMFRVIAPAPPHSGCGARTVFAAWLLAVAGFVAPVSASAADANAAAFDDGYYAWDTREVSLDDARAAISQFPRLVAHEALMLDRCGLHSINPRLAALLLDASGTLDSIPVHALDQAKTRVDAFLGALPHVFYMGRKLAAANRQIAPLQNETAEATAPEAAGINALAKTFLRGERRTATLKAAYLARFGVRMPVMDGGPQRKAGDTTSTANPPNWMRLPWLLGQQGWSFNGVHSSSGGCPNPVCAQPRASIDFSNGWPAWGTSTNRSPVLAAIDGTVTVFSSCNLRVTHANGWATSYYHLDNIRVTNGSTVIAGQNLADYADNQTQALCTGGSSTGPHVHFTMLNAGVQVELDQSDFSGWKVNATTVTRDYDSTCSRMYLTRDGNTVCPYNGALPTAWNMHTLATGMPSNKLCDLDVDGNGNVSAATDGVLLLRYLLGLRDAALTSGGVVGSGATRSTPAAIEAFLATKRYDLDGDNATRSHIDGLLAVRLMSGATGTALSGGATAVSSILTTGAAITALAAGCR